jgi:hypothetical protein
MAVKKWSHLKDQEGIVRHIGTSGGTTERRERVNKLKAILEGLEDAEVLLKMAEIKKRRDELDEEQSRLNEGLDAATEVIVSRWEDEGIDKLRLAGVGTFSLLDTPYGNVADRPKFLEWIRETGQEDMLSVNASRVSALVKDALENGLEPPPGTSFFLKTEIRQYKG